MRDERKTKAQLIEELTSLRRRNAELEVAEEALEEPEGRYRDLYDNAPDMYVSVDAETAKILRCNQTLATALGYGKEEIVGRPIFAMYHPDCMEEVQKAFHSFVETGEVDDAELQLMKKDGGKIDVSLNASAVRDSEGRVLYSRSAWRDISERKRAEEKLERYTGELARSNAELEQFAYVVSHDLQEPLRAVTSYLQLLERRYAERLDGDGRRFIERTIGGAGRMKRLINDLLVYSRVSTRGKEFEPVDCGKTVEEALANLQSAIEDSGAAVSFDELPLVQGDVTQLMQLFQNLIGNAIKFHNEISPQVHIGAEKRDGEWVIWVRDNGIGIEPQYFERIFGVFQRLHSRQEYAGTGIGLAVCKKIAERHGGRIWVESESGAGSTFYFTIPDREEANHESEE